MVIGKYILVNQMAHDSLSREMKMFRMCRPERCRNSTAEVVDEDNIAL